MILIVLTSSDREERRVGISCSGAMMSARIFGSRVPLRYISVVLGLSERFDIILLALRCRACLYPRHLSA